MRFRSGAANLTRGKTELVSFVPKLLANPACGVVWPAGVRWDVSLSRPADSVASRREPCSGLRRVKHTNPRWHLTTQARSSKEHSWLIPYAAGATRLFSADFECFLVGERSW